MKPREENPWPTNTKMIPIVVGSRVAFDARATIARVYYRGAPHFFVRFLTLGA